jgi:universal stress protein A
MTAYRRILAAIDLTQDSQVVADRACEIARAGNASVQLLHVVEIIPIEPMSDSVVPMIQIDEQMMLRNRERMAALLLVLGSRERHGLSILLHRTEDSVLHGAPCDVLAVRVR